MIYKVLAIRDRAADLFGQPMFFGTVGTGIRAFGDEVKRVDANNNLNKHPEDFDLYHIANYNEEEGSFEVMRPQQVAVGKDFI